MLQKHNSEFELCSVFRQQAIITVFILWYVGVCGHVYVVGGAMHVHAY